MQREQKWGGQQRKKLTSFGLIILGLGLVILDESRNQVGLVSGLSEAALLKQLLELGHLHAIVVGHGGDELKEETGSAESKV